MSERASLRGPAIALLELESIARGYRVADAVLKRADVHIALAEAVSPGKFLLLFDGGVAEVEESLTAGKEAAGSLLVGELFLTGVHDALIAALQPLGPVRHLVAPNIAHWTYVAGWQARFPDAVT